MDPDFNTKTDYFVIWLLYMIWKMDEREFTLGSFDKKEILSKRKSYHSLSFADFVLLVQYKLLLEYTEMQVI